MAGQSKSGNLSSVKTKRGVNPLIASFRRQLIDELIAEERQREKQTMMGINKVTIALMYGQVAVELTIEGLEESISPEDVKNSVDGFIAQGFTPRTYSRLDSGSKVGKKGTVVKVEPKTGTKMFTVHVTLDDGAGAFEFNAFRATDYRVKDRVTVVKNDRGFLEGQVIIDNGEQKEIPF